MLDILKGEVRFLPQTRHSPSLYTSLSRVYAEGPRMTTANRIFSLFSFLGIVLCCLPLRQHMQAWNAGTCLNIAWTVLACLNFFINSVIWNDNLSNPAPVWCDISTRVDIACNIAIPVAFLCTLRRIYLITTGNMPSAIATLKKRHAVMCDFTAGLGIPLVVVILAYIPQNSRFAIYEDFGCVTAISNTPVGILLRNLPQLVVSLACVVYSGLTLRHLHKKYSELNEHLSSGNTINKSQYLRVLIIATLGSICVFPFSFYWFVTDWTTVYSWQGWKQVHSNFSDVSLIPNSFWRANPSSQYGTEVSRWAFVFNAFAIFVCFGIHEEARKNYLSAVQYILRYAPWFHIEKSRTSAEHDTRSARTKMPPLAFAINPALRKLQLLDCSSKQTGVIGDSLPQTQISLSSMATYSELSGECKQDSLPHHSILQTAAVAPMVGAAAGA